MYFSVILVAAGSSIRAGKDKLFIKIGNQTVLEKSFSLFARIPEVNEIITVCREEKIDIIKELLIPLSGDKRVVFAAGGFTRSDSVRNGLNECDLNSDITAIHDAARPFASAELVLRTMTAALEFGAAAPFIPLKDTILHIDGSFADNYLNRDEYKAVQTPQIFNTAMLKAVYSHTGNSYTDECSRFISIGKRVAVTEGEESNIKITTKEDIQHVEANFRGMRIGHGYDAHRFAENRALWLCGVKIDYSPGLLGHSDADVAIHALMDALLGATCLPNIGVLFPPSDPKYKDISSMALLSHVMRMIFESGYRLVNADITIIAEAPKLAQYTEKMRLTLSEALYCGAVNIKATTEEGMGFTGRKEGIAAHAVVLIN